MADADGPGKEENIGQNLHIDEQLDKGECCGIGKVLSDDGLDCCIGDHECCHVDDPVHDLGGLVEDVDGDEAEQPEGDEDGHHIDYWEAVEWDLEDGVFEWFEIELGWLLVIEDYILSLV